MDSGLDIFHDPRLKIKHVSGKKHKDVRHELVGQVVIFTRKR